MLLPLNDTRNPANGCNRPSKHVDVNDELSNITGGNCTCHGLFTTNVNGKNSAKSNENKHGGKEQSVDSHQF